MINNIANYPNNFIPKTLSKRDMYLNSNKITFGNSMPKTVADLNIPEIKPIKTDEEYINITNKLRQDPRYKKE